MKKCMSIAIIICIAFILQANAHPSNLFKYQKITPSFNPINPFWTKTAFQSHFFSTRAYIKNKFISYENKEKITDSFINKALLKAKHDFPGEYYLNEQDRQDLKNQIIKGNLQLKSLTLRRFVAYHLNALCDSIHWIKILKLNDLNIKKLPENFINLYQLEELYLSNNNLKKLPEEIGNLKALTTLYLNDNDLLFLPKSIGDLPELKIINLNRNQNLQIIPRSFLKLTKLEQILLNNTNLNESRSINEYVKNADENDNQASYEFTQDIFENSHIHYNDLEELFEKSPIWDNCFYQKKE